MTDNITTAVTCPYCGSANGKAFWYADRPRSTDAFWGWGDGYRCERVTLPAAVWQSTLRQRPQAVQP